MLANEGSQVVVIAPEVGTTVCTNDPFLIASYTDPGSKDDPSAVTRGYFAVISKCSVGRFYVIRLLVSQPPSQSAPAYWPQEDLEASQRGHCRPPRLTDATCRLTCQALASCAFRALPDRCQLLLQRAQEGDQREAAPMRSWHLPGRLCFQTLHLQILRFLGPSV